MYLIKGDPETAVPSCHLQSEAMVMLQNQEELTVCIMSKNN